MTREDAIKELQESLDTLREYDIAHSSRLKQSLEMAIRTLENHDTFMKYAYSYGKQDALSQEPCSDAISRDAVIMECIKYADHEHNVRLKKEVSETRKHDAQVIIYVCDYFKTFVEKLPSVTQKSGKWILLDECANSGYYCSNCQKKLVKEGWSNTVKKINYCPNCGARMEGEVNNG